jgi:2-polyprenyl-6-methoxyphenol hydroxylase-like FAD-dependent oxidoreductase
MDDSLRGIAADIATYGWDRGRADPKRRIRLERRGKVLIIGGGIGGLTLGVALSRAGIECEIFERDQELRTVGSGLLLQSAPMRAFQALGLDQEVLLAGRELEAATVRSADGRTLQHTDWTFLRAEFGQPTVAMHRAALHEVLLAALGGIPLHFGKRLVQYRSEGDGGVVAQFDDGSLERGAVLVGADGLRSAVRRQLLNDGPPRYAGYSTYRGTLPAGREATIKGALQWLGRGRRFGLVPIGRGEAYWFAGLSAPEGESPGDPKHFLAEMFRDFASPVPETISATPEDRILRTDIHDREPVARWSGELVTLLGDAAHPTTPNLGQGAGLAIEDAVVLARHLAGESNVALALKRYESDRTTHTSRVVKASRKVGQVGQLDGAISTRMRNLALRMTPVAVLKRQLRDIAQSGIASLPAFLREAD